MKLIILFVMSSFQLHCPKAAQVQVIDNQYCRLAPPITGGLPSRFNFGSLFPEHGDHGENGLTREGLEPGLRGEQLALRGRTFLPGLGKP